ncbi:MAG: glutathione peroxidase [Actinomycetota bacterium]
MTSAYEFSAIDIDGKERQLSEFEGRPLLIVNVASHCGFTPQYRGLEEMWRHFGPDRLVVLGFPSDQFNQEPGDEEEIKNFCSLKYDVTFPLFAKIDVNGDAAHPLWEWLRSERPGIFSGNIRWNFTKFLIDQDGQVVHRYRPTDTPERISRDVAVMIESNGG